MSKYECPICNKYFNNSINQPYLLKCGDTICSQCINFYEKTKRTKKIECPICCSETESTGIINKFVLLNDNKETRMINNMDRRFNIKNLKLIKQIKGKLFKEITLLKDKRLCSIEEESDDKRKLTIYDKDFNSQIEIKPIGELFYPQSVASLEPNLLAYKSYKINIIELEGNKYRVIQTIDHSANASLYSFKNLLVFSAIDCNEESGIFGYKKNSFNKYEPISKLEKKDLCYHDYTENHSFNGKEFNIYCSVNHPTYGIEYNGKMSEPSYFTLYYPNQLLFIEPSFIILGEQEFLFDLKDPELKIIEKNPIIHDTPKDTVYPYTRTKAYINISKNSFLYLNEHLYQFEIINEKSFKLINERKDIKGFDLIIIQDNLIIATPGEIMIYKFCN